MKTKTIKGIKVKVFEELELIEKLNLTKEKANLVLKYQSVFPELLQGIDGFIDGETLCKELGVKDNYNTWLLGETRLDSKGHIKSQGKLIKYRCIEGKDYEVGESQSQNRNKCSKNIIKLTVNCAKKIAMRQNNEMGDLVCDYFILMEEAVRDYENWNVSRGIEKDGWNRMTKCIEDWCKRKGLDYTIRQFYIREANLLNESLLGFPAIEINWMLKNNDKLTRNHLTTQINNAINFLQELNCSLLFADMEFQERKQIVETTCKNKYSNLKIEFEKFIEEINK